MEPKADARERMWRTLEHRGVVRFPGARGRIPNFVGAEQAARMLGGKGTWRRARHIKCNPDLPQRPVRHAALQQGKCLYMAVPRLADARPFVVLDPSRLQARDLWAASSIKGAMRYGTPVSLDEMPRLDLIVLGSVAVASDGARLGKGGGYADLEFAVLREARKAHARTPVATTVHPVQCVPPGTFSVEDHDVTVDWVVTPAGVSRCDRGWTRPNGVLWDLLPQETIDRIPVLREREPTSLEGNRGSSQ
jgi:5-formyltetrahydrofolate cyclo-ligase